MTAKIIWDCTENSSCAGWWLGANCCSPARKEGVSRDRRNMGEGKKRKLWVMALKEQAILPPFLGAQEGMLPQFIYYTYSNTSHLHTWWLKIPFWKVPTNFAYLESVEPLRQVLLLCPGCVNTGGSGEQSYNMGLRLERSSFGFGRALIATSPGLTDVDTGVQQSRDSKLGQAFLYQE